MLEALRAAGSTSGASEAAASWLATQTCPNTDYLSRRIAVSVESGAAVDADIATLTAGQNPDGGFGLAAEHASDPFDTALALTALARARAAPGAPAGVEPTARVDERIAAACSYLASAQNPDGGWGWAGGRPGKVMVGAAVLAGLGDARRELGEARIPPGVQAAVERGSEWLVARSGADGAIGDGVADTALSYLALKAAGASFDERGAIAYLARAQRDDGRIGDDTYETALALRALVAAQGNLAVDPPVAEPPAVRAGRVTRVSATISNTSENAAPRSELVWQAGPATATTLAAVSGASVSPLAPGESTTLALNLDTSAYLGPVRVRAHVDPDDRLLETDEADNARDVTVDVLPPLLAPTLLAPPDGAFQPPSGLVFSWQAGTAQVDLALRYRIELDRSPAFDSPAKRSLVTSPTLDAVVSHQLSGDVDPPADGPWYWRVRAVDAADEGPWSSARRVVVDGTPPSMTSLSASPTHISPNGDGIQDASLVSFTLDDAAWLTSEVVDPSGRIVRTLCREESFEAGPGELTWDGTDDAGSRVPDGGYTVRLIAADAAGNEAHGDVGPITVDTLSPVITDLASTAATFSPNGDGYVDSVAFGWSVSQPGTVTASVRDAHGVVIRTVSPAGLASWSWDGKNALGVVAPDGTYSVGFSARDDARNRSADATRAVTIKTRCLVGKTMLEPPSCGPGQAVRVNVAVADDSTVSVTVAGTTHVLADPDGDGVHTADITAPAQVGNHAVTLDAGDTLGNRTARTDVALTVIEHAVTGQAWVQDTYGDFAQMGSLNDSTTAEAVPGSVVLASKGWQIKTPMPTPRYNAAAVLGPGGKIHVIGGRTNWNGEVAAHEVYDPATDSWESRAPLPEARGDLRAVLAPDGRIYALGGSVGNGNPYEGPRWSVDRVERYDPATDTWERDNNHGGTLAPMPTDRCVFGMATGPDGRIYAFGGYRGLLNDGGSTDAVEVYDPVANTWESLAPMPQPQCCFAFASQDGTIYVMEGETRRNAPTATAQTLRNNTWAYQSATDTWEARTPSPVAREDVAAASAADGSIYVFGGRQGGGVLNYAYAPASDSWRRKNDLPLAVYEPAGAADLDGKVYSFGGVREVWSYIYTRDWVQCFESDFTPAGTYTSVTKDFGRQAAYGTISWDADLPEGSTIALRTRTSNDGVTWSAWSDPYITSGAQVMSPPGQVIQYRVEFATTRPFETPRVDRVAIVYNLAPTVPWAQAWFREKTATPDLYWGAATDAEGDALTYELELDTSGGFDSADKKSFSGIVANAYTIPKTDPLADGRWQYRLRATDGHSVGPWSNSAPIDIDTQAPVVSGLSVDPGVIAPNASSNPTSAIRFTLSETAKVTVTVGDWPKRSWVMNSAAAGDHTVVFDGMNDQGALMGDGTHPVRITATDELGNQAIPAESSVRIRTAPRISAGPWASSVATDPVAGTTLGVSVVGAPTQVSASVEGSTRRMIEQQTPGVFSGRLVAQSAGRLALDSVAAHDAQTGNEARLSGLALDVPGYLGASAWVQGVPDFASGTTDSVTVLAGRGLGLTPASWRVEPFALSQAREGIATCVLGGKAYLFGGYASGYSGTAESVDLATGQRQTLAPMPTARGFAAAAAGPDGRLYVLGGAGGRWGAWLDTVEAYDPATDTWQSLPGMGVARYGAVAATGPDGRIYVAAGCAPNDQSASLQAFNPATGVWQTLAPVPANFLSPAACRVAGRMYLFGGRLPAGGTLRAAYSYDFSTGSWSSITPLPLPAEGHSAVLGDDGKVYVFGKLTWAYDPATDAYTDKAAPVYPRTNAAGVGHGGRLYLMGGRVASGYWGYLTANIESFGVRQTGAYTSPVKDTGERSEWGRIGWTAVLPAKTGLSVRTRSSSDGQAWSAWSADHRSGDLVGSPPARYLQYRVAMETLDSPATPLLGDVAVAYRAAAAQAPLAAPSPTSPAAGEVIFAGAPTLAWTNAAGGEGSRRYKVQLDTSPSFDSPALRTYPDIGERVGQSLAYVPSTNPLPDGPWHWRVRAADENGDGPWSETSAFTVTTRPDLTVPDGQVVAGQGAPVEGDVVTITATVRNLGAPAADVAVRFFHGDPSAGVRLGHDEHIAALGHLEERRVVMTYDTLGRARGRDIHVVVDPEDAVAESDETNNTGATTLAVEPLGLTVTPVVAAPSYGASETVPISLAVANTGSRTRDLTALVTITDADGAEVEAVGIVDLAALAPGETRLADLAWHTGRFYAGDYAVHARLVEAGRTLAAGLDGFAIEPDLSLTARVTVDRISYSAHDTVRIRSRLINESLNLAFTDLRLSTTITGPGGETIFAEDTTVAVLNTGELKDIGRSWNVGVSAPGTYTVTDTVAMPSGLVLAASSRDFAVRSSAESAAGLTGAIDAAPTTIHQGDTLDLAWTLANAGNADLAGVPVTLVVADPEDTSTVIELAAEADIARDGTASGADTADTSLLPYASEPATRHALAILRADVGPYRYTLGAKPVTMLPVLAHATLAADASAYDCAAPVALAVDVTNDTTDHALDEVTTVLTITGPAGDEILRETTTLADVAFGETRQLAIGWDTGRNAPGSHAARVTVTHRGMTLAATDTAFDVLSTAHTGTGLAGSLAAPQEVRQGETVPIAFDVANLGNADVAGLPLRVAVTDAATGEELAAFEASPDVALDQTASGVFVLDTDTLERITDPAGRALELSLAAAVPAGVRTLASRSLTVLPGVLVDVSKETTAIPRVLVWAQNAQTRAFAKDTLQGMDSVSQVVTTQAELVGALRSDVFSTLVMLDTTSPLTGHADGEVADWVAAGGTLVGSGEALGSNFKQTGVFGVRFKGHTPPGTYTVPIPQTAYTPAGTITAQGKLHKVQPTGATALASAGSLPAVTVNSHGKGTAVLVAFELARAREAERAQVLLATAIRAMTPAPACAPGAVVPVRITLTNRGIGVHLAVAESVSAGEVAWAAGASQMSPTTASWDLTLGEGETRRLAYLLRLSDAPGPVELSTVVSYELSGAWQPYLERILTLDVTP